MTYTITITITIEGLCLIGIAVCLLLVGALQ